MTKTILILGAGIEQTTAIKLAKEMGLKVIAVDGNPNAPGLKILQYLNPYFEKTVLTKINLKIHLVMVNIDSGSMIRKMG